MAAQRPRPLFLHTSALSDAEYTAYFDALHDIFDEPEPGGGTSNSTPLHEDLEVHTIGMREARAWMRGRFKNMGLNNVDKVCFSQIRKFVWLMIISGFISYSAFSYSNGRSFPCLRRMFRTTVSRQDIFLPPLGFSCMHGTGRT